MKKHPRDGYVVALFHGESTNRYIRGDVLVEIFETYNTRDETSSQSWHYRAYHKTGSSFSAGESKTIGFIGPFKSNDKVPPVFVQGQFPDMEWRRLR